MTWFKDTDAKALRKQSSIVLNGAFFYLLVKLCGQNVRNFNYYHVILGESF
ncbi:hypothetical protein AKG98_3076 [Moritella sp. JT01]|nr:hypothetical protein AKG98_3076 [Moritella sp. JT01]